MSAAEKEMEQTVKTGAGRVPWLGASALTTMLIFVYLTFWWAPEDLVQGPVQRIFYPHVASAWIAGLAFAVVFVCSILVLVKRDLKWDPLAAASAQVGLIFTTGTLVMGMMWAKAVWGVYWDWDPRLTSVLVLWLLYLVYVALRSYVPDPGKKARYSAVLGIIAFLDVPIIYFSIKLWRTLHPAQVIGGEGDSGLPPEMLATLLFGVFTMTVLYAYFAQLRLRANRLDEELKREVSQ